MLGSPVELLHARTAAQRLQQVIEAVRARVLEQAEQILVVAGERGTRSSSREHRALAKACLNVRPIAITSPTDFMCVVSPASAPGNFSNAKRGHLTTQ